MTTFSDHQRSGGARAVSASIEREVKFELPADAVVPELAGQGPVASQDFVGQDVLAATYFDTEDKRLVDAGITLRRRSGGSDAGWHLKLPAPGGHRQELHAPVLAATATVPPELVRRVSHITGDVPLVPVARIDTTRSTSELRDQQRRLLATLADDQVTGELPQRSVALRWRELEIELAPDADDALLDTLTTALRGTGVVRSRWSSKLKRLLSEGGA